MATHPIPDREGFWWAKWRIADDGTYENEDEFSPSDEWEVVEVYENALDADDPEHFRVFVGGVTRGQSLENFVWGPGPITPPQIPPPPLEVTITIPKVGHPQVHTKLHQAAFDAGQATDLLERAARALVTEIEAFRQCSVHRKGLQ